MRAWEQSGLLWADRVACAKIQNKHHMRPHRPGIKHLRVLLRASTHSQWHLKIHLFLYDRICFLSDLTIWMWMRRCSCYYYTTHIETIKLLEFISHHKDILYVFVMLMMLPTYCLWYISRRKIENKHADENV